MSHPILGSRGTIGWLATLVALGCVAVPGCSAEGDAGSLIANGPTDSSMTTRWLFDHCGTNGFVTVGEIGLAEDGTGRAKNRFAPSPDVQSITWSSISASSLLISLPSGSGTLFVAGLRNISGSIADGAFTATIVNQDGSSLDGCVFNLVAGAIDPSTL